MREPGAFVILARGLPLRVVIDGGCPDRVGALGGSLALRAEVALPLTPSSR
jgi:hypothetical protein